MLPAPLFFELLKREQADLMNKTTIMPIKKNVSGTDYELMVPGHIDGEMANELEVETLEAIRQGATQIYVNLSEAEFLCSAAIRVLMQYYRQLKKQGKSLCVTSPSKPVDDALELTGFRDLIVEKT